MSLLSESKLQWFVPSLQEFKNVYYDNELFVYDVEIIAKLVGSGTKQLFAVGYLQ